MTALPKEIMSADEFLAWAATQPKEAGKFELIDGIVVMQQSERLVHAEVKGALYATVRAALRRGGLPCHVVVDGPQVRVRKNKVYQPDGIIYCGDRVEPDVIEVNTPIIVWEVLSPDSIARDHGEKLAGYFTLPDVHHYLIVDPEGRRINHHRRGQGDELLTRILSDGSLRLDPPGLEIAVADVFERG